MKRLFGIICAFFMCMAIMAGNPKVVSGKKELKNIYSETASVLLTIDWSDAKYSYGKSMEKVWEEKYDYMVKSCKDNFIRGFAEENEKLHLGDVDDAQYKMNVKVTNLDKYFNVMNIVPGHTVKVWCDVTISNAKGEKLAEIKVDEMKGGRDASPDDCYGKAFYILGKRIANL